MMGSQMITLLLSSPNERLLNERRDILLSYQDLLGTLSRSDRDTSAATKLPLVRLNLIAKPLFGQSL